MRATGVHAADVAATGTGSTSMAHPPLPPQHSLVARTLTKAITTAHAAHRQQQEDEDEGQEDGAGQAGKEGRGISSGGGGGRLRASMELDCLVTTLLGAGLTLSQMTAPETSTGTYSPRGSASCAPAPPPVHAPLCFVVAAGGEGHGTGDGTADGNGDAPRSPGYLSVDACAAMFAACHRLAERAFPHRATAALYQWMQHERRHSFRCRHSDSGGDAAAATMPFTSADASGGDAPGAGTCHCHKRMSAIVAQVAECCKAMTASTGSLRNSDAELLLQVFTDVCGLAIDPHWHDAHAILNAVVAMLPALPRIVPAVQASSSLTLASAPSPHEGVGACRKVLSLLCLRCIKAAQERGNAAAGPDTNARVQAARDHYRRSLSPGITDAAAIDALAAGIATAAGTGADRT